MFVCPSSTLRVRDVVPLKLWGTDLVAFRGEDGMVGLLGAYCTHMGTHVGYGGYVKGCSVVCPYHEWAFNRDGELTCIPYIEDGGPRDCARPQNRMRKYPVIEKHGMIFAWMHADEAAEPFDLWIASIPEKKGLCGPIMRTVLGRFNMHCMEPAHNSCDWYHFLTVHSVLGQHWKSSLKMVQPEIWSPPARCRLVKAVDDDGTELAPDVVITDQKMKSLRILGIRVPQSIVDAMMIVQVRFSGLMLGSMSMTLPLLGTYYGIVTITPEGPFRTHVELWSFTDWRWPRALTWLVSKTIMRTLNQDREVWERRTQPTRRNMVKNDYRWGDFDYWVDQFYSPGSAAWGDDQLDW